MTTSQFIPCEGGCEHTQDEHDAFDLGLSAGKLNPVAANPFSSVEQPSLWFAWESGASVGIKNRQEERYE